jgi:hypothetical protein
MYESQSFREKYFSEAQTCLNDLGGFENAKW